MHYFNFKAMRKLFHIILPMVALLVLAACNQYYTNQYIEIKEDGLIYKVGRDNPFTGRIIDTLSNTILEYEVVNGLKNGEFKISLFNGNVTIDGKVKNNLNTGEWKYYYDNGKLESHGNFFNDYPQGKWTWYYNNGTVKEEGTFWKGKKTGDWYRYSKDNRMLSIISYDNGEKLNEVKFPADRKV
ncbi:MORN repeat variant [bacterium BMS3Abin03]|nr:MORN repeat variant [bacterium BMS3Abin03]